MSFTQESTNYSANRSNADHTMQVLVNIGITLVEARVAPSRD